MDSSQEVDSDTEDTISEDWAINHQGDSEVQSTQDLAQYLWSKTAIEDKYRLAIIMDNTTDKHSLDTSLLLSMEDMASKV